MPRKNYKFAGMGKTKKSTDELINEAVARQQSWLYRKSKWARSFFKRPAPQNKQTKIVIPAEIVRERRPITAFWFPILCALIVIAIILWVLFSRPNETASTPAPAPIPVVAEESTQKNVLDENAAPVFDLVRIEKEGYVIIAGRGVPNKNISVLANNKLIATERTDANGEFIFAPQNPFKPGNYTVSLLVAETGKESVEDVFVYISPRGADGSISLLMTKDGSTLLQAPVLADGDLQVSKIDYLSTGRIVVTGDALPRLRVSLTLNGKYLGFARVSDYRHFGLGADVDQLEPGKKYKLEVRLHDGDGMTVATITHKFKMPTPTGNDDTFYTVRRGDALWIIAKNFLRRGVLFSIIADANDIENPDLIFPKQVLRIPVEQKN